MIDWSLGSYERTAAELEPVAEHVVSLAAPLPGEHLLDLATGTGNAALLAARRGASVTGVDTATRLVDVARDRAADEHMNITFVEADVQALPFEAGSFDVAVSVFGLIFAADSQRAFAELRRVLKPSGRAFITAWIPAGAIDAMIGVFMRAAAPAVGGAPPRRFAWSNTDAVSELAAQHGVGVSFSDAELKITAASPEAYLRAGQEHHPMSVSMRGALEQAGTYETTQAKALAVLREHNEDPAAFAVTSPYRVIEIRR